MSDEIREALRGRDRAVWREIQEFEETRPGGGLARLAAAPLQAMIPDRVHAGMRDALGSLIDAVRGLPQWDPGGAKLAKDAGYRDLDDLRARAPIDEVLTRCDAQCTPALLKATLQGAGLGFGGVMLAVADVPLLLLSHLQLLVRLGTCAGYDLRPAGERPFLLGMLELAYCLGDWEGRQDAIEGLGRRIARRPGPAGDGDQAARRVFLRSMGAFTDKIGPVLLRRRFATAMPLIGSVFGAGANYALTRDVAAAARHTLAKRLLTERVRG